MEMRVLLQHDSVQVRLQRGYDAAPTAMLLNAK